MSTPSTRSNHVPFIARLLGMFLYGSVIVMNGQEKEVVPMPVLEHAS